MRGIAVPCHCISLKCRGLTRWASFSQSVSISSLVLFVFTALAYIFLARCEILVSRTKELAGPVPLAIQSSSLARCTVELIEACRVDHPLRCCQTVPVDQSGRNTYVGWITSGCIESEFVQHPHDDQYPPSRDTQCD